MKRYITTAIDYPNAAPHMGHVLEKVLADVIARYWRLNGDEVRFQIGTDEHGIKIQQTADKEKMTPKQLVDRNAPLFQSLYERLHISADHFIRTTDSANHWPTVRAVWEKIKEAGMLEKRTYTGLYCTGCERFLTKRDLVDGLCAIHQRAPEEVKEENWFFKMSEKSDWLKQILTDGTYKIVPDFRAPETLTLIEQGLEDVSFSRPKTSLEWGIPVPGEEDTQTMYVWCDALTNYISGLGAFTNASMMKEWWDGAEVTHVIGKDIARFHALIWPAMLECAKVRTPDRLLIHGFLTSDGQKMSKSLGNVVQPEEVLAHFGGNPDPLRFYLSHEIPVGNDGDFSWKRIDELYDAKLRNQIGNLLNRVLVLINRDGSALTMPPPSMNIMENVASAWSSAERRMAAMEPQQALHEGAVALTETCNVQMQERQPWKLVGDERKDILSGFAEALRHVSLLLLPFIPETAQKMSVQLGVPYASNMLEKDFVITSELKQWGGCKAWAKVGEPSILFAQLEAKKD